MACAESEVIKAGFSSWAESILFGAFAKKLITAPAQLFWLPVLLLASVSCAGLGLMKAPGLGSLGYVLVIQQMGRPRAQRNMFPLPSAGGVVEEQGLLVGLGQGEGPPSHPYILAGGQRLNLHRASTGAAGQTGRGRSFWQEHPSFLLQEVSR